MIILKMVKAPMGRLKTLAKDHDISEQDMIDRILFVQALDTLRCYEEGVLESVIDANVGSIFELVMPRGRRSDSILKSIWY